jgi:hypothetical protein
LRRLIHNYWFRWFAGTFIIGAALIPIFLLVTFLLTIIAIQSLPGPSVFISNPFIDFTTTSGKTVVTGNAAWVLAILLSGFFGGLIGLAIAGLKRAFWK